MEPLVSVFIPYYNDELFLKKSIESVLSQTFNDFELILLNHVSNDGSRDIAHSFNDERIIHIDKEKNMGAGGGMLFEEFKNTAKGKYLKIFCADDVMEPDCLNFLVDYMEKNPEKDFVFANMDYIDEKGKELGIQWTDEHPDYNFKDSEKDIIKKFFNGLSFLPLPTVLMKKEKVKDLCVDKSFIMIFDTSLWAQLLINGCKIALLNNKIVKYRVHKNQTSSCEKIQLITQRSSFETFEFCNLFYEIKDYNIIKHLCEDNPLLKYLKENDTNYFKFILATEYFSHSILEHKNMAYHVIYDYIQNDKTRKELDDKFNFGIKEFRDMYSEEFKNAPKSPKEMGICKLLFLICRKIWKKITLQNLFKKKRYTT